MQGTAAWALSHLDVGVGPEIATEILELSVPLSVVQLPVVPILRIDADERPVGSLLGSVDTTLAATAAVVGVADIAGVALSFVAVVVVGEFGFSTSDIATA